MNPQRISIDFKVMESVLQYLATKPFNEVAGLIQSVQQDAKPIDGPDGPDGPDGLDRPDGQPA